MFILGIPSVKATRLYKKYRIAAITHSAARGFIINEDRIFPCARYTIEREEPQVGQGKPVRS
jgi:hypothetical protein